MNMMCVLLVAAGVGLFSPSIRAADEVLVPKPVPFSDSTMIAGNIKRECVIQDQLADFIAAYARERNIPVRFAAEVDAQAAPRVLDVQIKDAVSQGNPFMGHRKSTVAVGKLYQDGELIGSFTARRDSMGGAFAGYKGSCSVLGRTVKALGKDIAAWLAVPEMDALLGDLN